MKLRFIVPLLLSMIGALPVDAAEPFRYEVDIEAPADIKSVLSEHLDIVRSRGSERMSAEQLSRLIEATPAEASALLETEGYFTPRILMDYQKEQGAPRVHILVEPGEPVRISQVEVVLNGTALTPPDEIKDLHQQILERWPLPEGDVFRQGQWDLAKKRSLMLLQDKKFAAARIAESEARIDPDTRSVALRLVLESGEAYRFGAITISGLKTYPTALVRDQAEVALGGDYQRSELVDLQSSLHDLPHFTLVVVDTDVPETPPFEVPVHIDVQEAPRHKLSTGLGYSSNNGYKSEVGYRYLNLADRGWISESKVRFEQYEQSAETSVTFPRLSSGYQHSVSTGYLRSEVEGVLSHTWRMGLVRQRDDFNLSRTWSLEYLTERRELNDGTQETPKTLAAKFQWLRRDVDSVRDPRAGRLLQFETGGAYDELLSDTTFLKVYGRGVRYWPIGRKGVVIARAELGQTLAKDEAEVPTDWLFRTGGSGSVRGYDYQSLGVESNGSVTPGRVLATASLEYQHPVYQEWRAAAFIDHGGAGNRWQDFRTVSGVGVGARWVSPAGVLGLDVARGIDNQQWRLHIALGLAF